jgi:hypothetical protein
MRRLVAIALAMFPAITAAQTAPSYAVIAGPYPVDSSSGTQTDPHVSGNVVAYTSKLATSSAEVRVYTGGTNPPIVLEGANPDIAGSQIAFTRGSPPSSAIYSGKYNATTRQYDVHELFDPNGSSMRDNAAISLNTVVWVDQGPTGSTSEMEIVAFDLPTDSATRITNNNVEDSHPAVAPDGNTIVWTRCEASPIGCDIFRADRVAGVWSAAYSITGAGEEGLAATDGTIVTYECAQGGFDRHLCYQFLAGVEKGLEKNISVLGGDQSSASVADGLIAFESRPDGTAATADIYVYDTATRLLYRLTNTPDVDERLSDIDVDATGIVTVVYVRAQPELEGGLNIYALSFTFEEEPSACGGPGEDPQDSCASLAIRATVATWALPLTRAPGAPNVDSIAFDSQEGTTGLLCVQNGSPTGSAATAGELGLNNDALFSSSDFQKDVASLEGRVQLQAKNVLWGGIAGEPGTSYTVTVYGPPWCGEGALLETSPLRARGFLKDELRIVRGEVVGVVNAAGGCSSTSATASLLALLAVVALVLRPRLQRARARRIERP